MATLVTAAQLRSTADQLEQLNSNFKTATENLTSVQQNLSGMWEGDAKRTFDASYQRDKTNMDAFNANITKYVGVLRSIAVKYEKAEQANVQIAQQRSY